MKTTRKILSILLVLAMVCALFVTGISAEGEGTVEAVKLAGLGKTGVIKGMKLAAEDITYLSDLHDQTNSLTLNDYVVDQGNNTKIVLNKAYSSPSFYYVEGSRLQGNGGGAAFNAETGIRTHTLSDGSTLEVHKDAIMLSYKGILFEKGLGVHPNTYGGADRYIVYNVSSLNAERFYALVGANGTEITKTDRNGRAVTFELWGSAAETYDKDTTEFVKLAYVDDIRAYVVGEFDIDISGYNYIKLVVKVFDSPSDSNTPTNASSAVSWGGACVYSLPDFTVNYDGNGGKTADDKTVLADEENVVDSDVDTVVFMVDNCTFEKEGYLFKGWNTKADGTGTDYAAGDALTLVGESNVTLYAQWEEKPAEITYYKVTYVADGQTVASFDVEAGKDATAPAVPVKEGYTAAWDKDGKAISADTTITAVYTIKTYTVTFVIPEQENTTATVEHGADVTLPTAPAKAGYLVVWDHTGKGITADTTITASYKREYKTVVLKLKQDPSGAPKGSNKTYLSDLHDASDDGKNLGLNKYVIDQGSNSKIILNASYSQPAFYFIEGGRKVGNGNGVDADGYRVFTRADGTTIKIHKNDIVLGYTGTRYEKGLGVHPNTKTGADRYIVYDISSLDVNAFYAVAGATAKGLTVIDKDSADWKDGRGVTFEVWGSTDETYNKNSTEFVKLAFVDNISGYNVGEFKVNIEGIKFLKLVVKVSPDATTNDSSAVAWGGAMVYKADTSADTSDGFSMTAIAAAIVAATSVVALVVNRKKFF